jgi:hypothetical protein
MGINESMYVEWKLSRPLNIMPDLYWYEVAKVLFALVRVHYTLGIYLSNERMQNP